MREYPRVPDLFSGTWRLADRREARFDASHDRRPNRDARDAGDGHAPFRVVAVRTRQPLRFDLRPSMMLPWN
jgi:hypothetical protein